MVSSALGGAKQGFFIVLLDAKLMFPTLDVSSDNDYLIAFALDADDEAKTQQYLFDSQFGRLVVAAVGPTKGVVAIRDHERGWQDFGVASKGRQVLVFDLRKDPGAQCYRNGAQLGSRHPYTPVMLTKMSALGGNYFNNDAPFNGRIGEVIIAKRPTNEMRDGVTRYLGGKFGISIS